MIPGCFGDKIVYPVQVICEANTFRLPQQYNKGKIIEVAVWDYQESKTRLVWLIKPTADVFADSFIVTAGEIPDNFTQIIPVPPVKFDLKPGTRYVIGIRSECIAHPGSMNWIAE